MTKLRKGLRIGVRILDSDQYEEHLREVLPSEEDEQLLAELFKREDWVEARAA